METLASPPDRFLQRLGSRGRALDTFLHRSFVEVDSPEYAKINNIIVITIFVSIFLVILESVESIHRDYGLFFDVAEGLIVAIFTLEYFINFYFSKTVYGKRWKYALSVWGLIDLAAILPSYLRLLNLSALKSLRIFRILRFLRMLRVIKLAKSAAGAIRKSQHQKVNTLKFDIQIYAFTMVSVVVMFGTAQFLVEGHVNPNFNSIPDCMWWCIVTITTVGYGDTFPITPIGKVIAVGAMLCGLVLFGMLMNVVGKAMMDLLFGGDLHGEGAKPATSPVMMGGEATHLAGNARGVEVTIRVDEAFHDTERLKRAFSAFLDQLSEPGETVPDPPADAEPPQGSGDERPAR